MKNLDKDLSKADGGYSITPMIKQYSAIKARYPDAILFFRMGDFYEMFFDDARIASGVLNIVLTTRGKDRGEDIPLAGFPWKALDEYLAKMVKAGYKVAICEQMEDPKKAKGIVKRDVIDVVTAGTVTTSNLLDPKEAIYLASVAISGNETAIAYIDITTGIFKVSVLGFDGLIDEIARISPRELLLPLSMKDRKEPWNTLFPSITITLLPEYYFMPIPAERALLDYFGLANLKGWGLENKTMIQAAGAITSYLSSNKKDALAHIDNLEVVRQSDFLQIDRATLNHLEILSSLRDKDTSKSLAGVMDRTRTAMGARLLREWLCYPLYDIKKTRARHDIVSFFLSEGHLLTDMQDLLSNIPDIERISGRAALGRISPRQVLGIATSIRQYTKIYKLIEERHFEFLLKSIEIKDLTPLAKEIEETITDAPPHQVGDGNTIREGVNPDLDHSRALQYDSKGFIARLENKERERSGIDRLKIKYNRVFGYYIEVPNSYKGNVPDDFIRKQTTANAERYFTPQIKQYEEQILEADDRIRETEIEVFDALVNRVKKELSTIKQLARIISRLDVLASFARCARDYDYVRPVVEEGTDLEIKDGRHAVIEHFLGTNEFIPNDVFLNPPDKQIIILTGPNMSGKSTYLRQIALIVLLSQAGSFVPAAAARIGLVDRLFTRVGASDDILGGASTFLVEMNETAYILNQASNRSLVLLDEIGRGTSTYDGLSIAWAVVEYLHNTEERRAKTIFATHYHELTVLEEDLSGVINHTATVQETEEGYGAQPRVLFLRKIKRGCADKSYGIHVAKMAGIPKSVINRANIILHELEENQKKLQAYAASNGNSDVQLTLFSPPSEVIAEEIRGIDLNRFSPIEVMQLVERWKRELSRE